MKEFIINITTFLREDFFPNLPFYLLQVFLVVLVVILFAGINILVRFITDPVCYKIFRMKEHKSGPGMVAFVIALVISAFLLMAAYNAFPQMRPTVIGWAGHKLQQVLTSEEVESIKPKLTLDNLKAAPEKIKKKVSPNAQPESKPATPQPAGSPAASPPPAKAP